MSDERPALGVDLGGTKIHSVVATPAGDVLAEDRRPTLADEGPDAVIARIIESLSAALEGASLKETDVVGVGISTPGPCDPERGIVTDAPNLKGWHNVPLRQRVGDGMGLPAVMENDANAAAYGELCFGAGQGLKHIVYVTLGTGIGGGIIIDGKIYDGASGAAGEVGHLVVQPDGPRCNCGNRGCVEALASGPAIARAARASVEAGRSPQLEALAAGGSITAELVHRAALEGDEGARAAIEQAGTYLGLGLTGLLNVFNPQALILGGGLLNLGDAYLGPAIDTARRGAFEQAVADATITLAKLGERAGALGASALVMTSPAG